MDDRSSKLRWDLYPDVPTPSQLDASILQRDLSHAQLPTSIDSVPIQIEPT